MLATASLVSTGASAQSAGGSAAQVAPIETVTVTALRRATSVQSTPITITAVTGASLANAGIQDVSGLKQSVPNLSFVDAGPSNTRVVIRGIQSAGEPTVGLYYDETPVTGAVGAANDSGGSTPLLKLFDVKRVEVLRGPQGTLYGASSMAGTLRVIFNKPVFHYEGAVQGQVNTVDGGGDGYDLEGMVNVPLIEEKLTARLVLFNTDTAGYVDNINLHQSDVNTVHTTGGHFLVRFQPTTDFTVDGAIYYQTSSGGLPLWNLAAGKYKSTFATAVPDTDTLKVYNLTARWDLGSVTATAVASYMDRRLVALSSDVTGFLATYINNPGACAHIAGGGAPCSPAAQTAFNAYVQSLLPNGLVPHQHTTVPTFEFRLNSTGTQTVDWTVGAFYSNRVGRVSNLDVGADPATGAFVPNRILYDREIKDQLTQIAGYGEAAWHVDGSLTLTAGTRYFEYGRHVGGATPIALDLIGTRVTPYEKVQSSESGWISKFNASYKLNDDVLFYAQASQGYRPGGVNQVVGLPTALSPYHSDGLWDYELGGKTSWFDGRLTLDVDGYLIDWSDMQVQGKTPNGAFLFISNAGAAQSKGIEIELAARPIAGLTIQANGAWSSNKLTKDQVSTNVFGPGVKGDRIPYTPDLMAGLSAQYLWPIADALDGFARADLNYVGSSYSEFLPANPFYRKLPAYTLTNVRLGLEEEDSNWGVYLYANNLFNQTAITYATASALISAQTWVAAAPPRTIGLVVTKKF